MEEKLISVVIPTYNAEKTMERAIESIQDSKVEIIIVLDGEQPETETVCRRLAENDQRIQILKQENQGCFVARRTGMLAAKGKYIMNLDSDDAYMPHTIEYVRELIEKYNEPDLIRFRYQKEPEGYDQYNYFSDGKEEHYLTKAEFKTQIYPMILNSYQLNAMWTNCIKKEYLEKIKLEDIGVRGYGEDLIVNLELFSDIQNVVFSEKICYRYITNPNSLTKSRDISKLLNNLEECIAIYTSFYHYLERWELDNKEYQKIIRYRIQKETSSLINLIRQEVNKLQD